MNLKKPNYMNPTKNDLLSKLVLKLVIINLLLFIQITNYHKKTSLNEFMYIIFYNVGQNEDQVSNIAR